MEEEIGDAMLSAGTCDTQSDAVLERLESGDVVMEEDIGDAMLSAGTGDKQSDAVKERLESGSVVKEDEDYVVQEIDVYFIPSPEKTELHVMQYPLRPSWCRYDFDACLKEIRVKPKSAQVEIDFQHGSSDQREPHSRKLTLISSTSAPTIASHAIGVLNGNKLYVSSVKAFQQMRPKIEIAEDGADKVMEEKVDRRGPKIPKDTIGKRPVASSKYQDKTISLDTQHTESEESWIPLKYHSSSSKASANCLKKLMAAKHSDIPSSVKQCDYLNSIFPKKKNDSMMQKIQSLSSLREALNGLGRDSEALKSWKLKESADPSFEKEYPSVAKQQKQLLEAHEPEIISRMKIFRKKEKDGATTNARLPVEKQEALSKALRLVFQDHSVHSLDTIGTGLQDTALSASLQNMAQKLNEFKDPIVENVRSEIEIMLARKRVDPLPTLQAAHPVPEIQLSTVIHSPEDGSSGASRSNRQSHLRWSKKTLKTQYSGSFHLRQVQDYKLGILHVPMISYALLQELLSAAQRKDT